jgi:predicted GIY-YIG superfamily endonuclease
MDHFVYIIYSRTLNRYYIGHCQNIEVRIQRHNQGNGARNTKKAKDWELRYTEAFDTRAEANQRELSIKKKKSRKYIEWIIANNHE